MSYASMSNTRFITRTALLAALYVVITYAFSFLSYQAVQFRISEVLMLLIFMDRRYLASLLLGCFLANLIGPFGLPDAVFGSLSTLVAGVLMIAIRRHLGNGPKALFLATLMPALGNGITAANIAVSKGWSDGSISMIASRDPSASSGDTSNLAAFLDVFNKTHSFNPDDIVAGAVGGTSPFRGSFEDMLLRIESTLAEDQSSTSAVLTNYSVTANEI